MVKNETWEVVDVHDVAHLVDPKWIYIIKYKSDETVERNKVTCYKKIQPQIRHRLLGDIRAIAKMNYVKIMLSLLVPREWNMYHLDVKNDFLNSNLEEEVYITIIPRYEKIKKYCRLKKALYGFKQSPITWIKN